MSDFSNSRENLIRWHDEHTERHPWCPHCEIVTLQGDLTDTQKALAHAIDSNIKLRKAIDRFKNAWEDSDSDDAIWEVDVEYSRTALFGQVEEKV